MKLFELFDVDKTIENIDSKYNTEINKERRRQQQYYKNNNMHGDSTPVFDKPQRTPKEKRWTTDPQNPANELMTSPGYIGRENAKRRANKEYDKKTPQRDPHSEVVLGPYEERIIKRAKKSLGHDRFNY